MWNLIIVVTIVLFCNVVNDTTFLPVNIECSFLDLVLNYSVLCFCKSEIKMPKKLQNKLANKQTDPVEVSGLFVRFMDFSTY